MSGCQNSAAASTPPCARAENPLRTFSRRQILDAVFESDEQPGTVDTYVHYLRRKTDPHIVSTVRGEGYRLGQP